jgi:SAM-dependent methyltransferase
MTKQPPEFDSRYYRRFYLTPATRATNRQQTQTQARLIAALVRQLQIPVRSILDIGCGLGWYRQPLCRAFPGAAYSGVEVSEFLCEKYGWRHGSVVDLKLSRRFDIVVCADVLQYLPARDAERAIANLARWCRGALYLHVPTKLDWQQNVDHTGTDGNVHVRSAAWYRQRLRRYFVHAGCGVHVSNGVPFAQWQLEEPWR